MCHCSNVHHMYYTQIFSDLKNRLVGTSSSVEQFVLEVPSIDPFTSVAERVCSSGHALMLECYQEGDLEHAHRLCTCPQTLYMPS